MTHHHSHARMHKLRNKNKHLMNSLIKAMIKHSSINISLKRAKALSMCIEPLIKIAISALPIEKKINQTQVQRFQHSRLYSILQCSDLVDKLLKLTVHRYYAGGGGYTRITKTHIRSDGTQMSQIQFV